MTKYFDLVYPDTRSVSEDTVRGWYADAVSDNEFVKTIRGEIEEGLTDIIDIIHAMEDIGVVAFGRNENYK